MLSKSTFWAPLVIHLTHACSKAGHKAAAASAEPAIQSDLALRLLWASAFSFLLLVLAYSTQSSPHAHHCHKQSSTPGFVGPVVTAAPEPAPHVAVHSRRGLACCKAGCCAPKHLTMPRWAGHCSTSAHPGPGRAGTSKGCRSGALTTQRARPFSRVSHPGALKSPRRTAAAVLRRVVLQGSFSPADTQ